MLYSVWQFTNQTDSEKKNYILSLTLASVVIFAFWLYKHTPVSLPWLGTYLKIIFWKSFHYCHKMLQMLLEFRSRILSKSFNNPPVLFSKCYQHFSNPHKMWMSYKEVTFFINFSKNVMLISSYNNIIHVLYKQIKHSLSKIVTIT